MRGQGSCGGGGPGERSKGAVGEGAKEGTKGRGPRE